MYLQLNMSKKFDVQKISAFSLLGLLLGFFIGVVSTDFIAKEELPAPSNELKQDVSVDDRNDETHFAEFLIENAVPNNIRENLRECAKEPHLAGTPRDEELARIIQKRFLENGFDTAELVPYDVLLSHPDPNRLNKIEILEANGDVLDTIIPLEPPLREDDRSETVAQAFHAFSPGGTVEGEVIFVSPIEIFIVESWEKRYGNISGKIVLTTAAHWEVPLIIKNLTAYGVAGLLTFPYTGFYSFSNPDKENLDSHYPDSDSLPGSGIVHDPANIHFGDLLTPGFPAKPDVYRLPVENLDLPTIPSQPISYNDAMKIFKFFDNFENQWSGVGNISGAGSRKVRLTIHNQMNTTRIYNVVGTIQGSVEPDRYVILGNHRDAWSYGGANPCSGTATMLELSRVFGEMRKTGWRPRRTLVFGSWTAKEMGFIGSMEWVEENLPKLRERAVSYINLDACVRGDIFSPSASPMLHEILMNATKMIPDPKEVENSFFEAWLQQATNMSKVISKKDSESMSDEPWIDPLGSVMSDCLAFVDKVSIPVIDISWRKSTTQNDPSYDQTGYDTFYLVDKFIDPTFKFHRTCVQLTGLMLLSLTDTKLLPFSLRHHKRFITDAVGGVISLINDRKPSLSQPLQVLVNNFTEAVDKWYEQLAQIDHDNPLEVRRFNDQMMQMERVFTVIDHFEKEPLITELANITSNIYHYSFNRIRFHKMLRDFKLWITREWKYLDSSKEDEDKIRISISRIMLVVNYSIQILKSV